jgi:cystathionine beta-lyase/cystathionine gamma-synthase
MEAWLLGRGLKTYALRMRQHNQSGALVAEALAKASGVAKVHYPGVASHPQHELARRQMPGGFGGMLSFEVAGSTPEQRFKRAQAVLRNVRLCTSAASLGGTETLITHPASMIFSHQSPDQLAAAASSRGCCGYLWVSSTTRILWTISLLRFQESASEIGHANCSRDGRGCV